MKTPTFSQWIAGARPRTLPLGIVPVLLGVACVIAINPSWFMQWPLILLCFLVAIFLQIGVNYANDYSDGIRGTDKKRVGPLRLVGSGLASPQSVFRAALICFGLASVCGLLIILLCQQWWLLAIGVLCLMAAWFYTGGKRPYGYRPLGELMVIIYFGLVPAVGTMYVLTGFTSVDVWLAGVAAGSFAAAVLMANNLRDREKDAKHGKRTLSVVAGPLISRYLYALFVLAPFVVLGRFITQYPASVLVYLILLFITIPTIGQLSRAKSAPELVHVLQRTVLMSLGFGLGLTTVILLS